MRPLVVLVFSVREQLDRRQAEQEPADVGEVGNAAAPRRRRGKVARPIERLEEEPGTQDEQGGLFDDREEDDDEQQRDHARAWI